MRFSRSSPACRPVALGLMAAVILCVLLGGRCTASAQDEISEADKETLRNYQLTIPKIDKLEAVVRKLVAAAKADPQVRKEIEALEPEKEVGINAMAEKFIKLAPHVTAVLKAEGTDPREFMVGMMSAMLASMGAKARGNDSFGAVQDFVPAGNIEFAEKHQPRFDLLEKALSEFDSAGKSE